MLVACGGDGSRDSEGSNATPRIGDQAPVTALREAIAALNRWDLPAYCRYFAPGAMKAAPQLRGATSCDDVQLQTLSTCEDCKKELTLTDAKAAVSGDHAVVQATIVPSPGSPLSTRKDITLERHGGRWLLVSNPDASVP